MAIFSTAVAVGSQLGAGGAISNVLGGIFGGSSEPNAGTENFVDVLDNYENISSSQASGLQSEIENIILNGGSNTQIGQAIANAGGYTRNEVMSSWKWDLVKSFVEQARQNYQAQQASGSGNQPSAISASAGGGGMDQTMLLWGAIGIGILFFLFRG